MEFVKLLVTVAAVLISVASFVVARAAAIRSRKAEEVRNLLGEKETVAFGALKLLRDGLPTNRRDRELLIAAVMQACIFERSSRARALLYRALEQNSAAHDPEFRRALQVVEDTFDSMSRYGFTAKEMDLENGRSRIGAVRKVLDLQSSR